MNKIPKVPLAGLCGMCQQWVLLERDDTLVVHQSCGNDCANAGNVAFMYGYRVTSPEEAQEVGLFLERDDDGCLFHEHHNASCHNGELCAIVREKLARALYEYVQQKKKDRAE